MRRETSERHHRADSPKAPSRSPAQMSCPRGDLNTEPRDISPVRGNHEVRTAGKSPAAMYPRPPARRAARGQRIYGRIRG